MEGEEGEERGGGEVDDVKGGGGEGGAESVAPSGAKDEWRLEDLKLRKTFIGHSESLGPRDSAAASPPSSSYVLLYSRDLNRYPLQVSIPHFLLMREVAHYATLSLEEAEQRMKVKVKRFEKLINASPTLAKLEGERQSDVKREAKAQRMEAADSGGGEGGGGGEGEMSGGGGGGGGEGVHIKRKAVVGVSHGNVEGEDDFELLDSQLTTNGMRGGSKRGGGGEEEEEDDDDPLSFSNAEKPGGGRRGARSALTRSRREGREAAIDFKASFDDDDETHEEPSLLADAEDEDADVDVNVDEPTIESEEEEDNDSGKKRTEELMRKAEEEESQRRREGATALTKKKGGQGGGGGAGKGGKAGRSDSGDDSSDSDDDDNSDGGRGGAEAGDDGTEDDTAMDIEDEDDVDSSDEGGEVSDDEEEGREEEKEEGGEGGRGEDDKKRKGGVGGLLEGVDGANGGPTTSSSTVPSSSSSLTSASASAQPEPVPRVTAERDRKRSRAEVEGEGGELLGNAMKERREGARSPQLLSPPPQLPLRRLRRLSLPLPTPPHFSLSPPLRGPVLWVLGPSPLLPLPLLFPLPPLWWRWRGWSALSSPPLLVRRWRS